MTRESRRLAGILLVVFSTVIYGGTSLLDLLFGGLPATLTTRSGRTSGELGTHTPGSCSSLRWSSFKTWTKRRCQIP